MPRKLKTKPLRCAPLQRIAAVPVDDPAEIAAFDRARVAYRQRMGLPKHRKSNSKLLRSAPLQRIVVEPIDDPAEIAAFESAREADRRKMRRASSRRANGG